MDRNYKFKCKSCLIYNIHSHFCFYILAGLTVQIVNCMSLRLGVIAFQAGCQKKG